MNQTDKIRKTFRGEGRVPSEGEGYERIFATPVGLFPKMVDAALRLGVAKSNLHKKFSSTKKMHSQYYEIKNPTKAQEEEAVSNMLETFSIKQRQEDHCYLCNTVDDMIFREGCWLLSVNHNHKSSSIENVIIRYSYGKKEYVISCRGWMTGKRPHLKSFDELYYD